MIYSMLLLLLLSCANAQCGRASREKKMHLQVFYETLCPLSQTMYGQLVEVVQKLGKYLKVETYPYGFADLRVGVDGKTKITCQHGPLECYGNRLHACALDIFSKNVTTAITFNGCVIEKMKNKVAPLAAARKCGKSLRINPKPITKCADSVYSSLLLRYMYEVTKQHNITQVPYIFVNSKVGHVNNKPDPYGRHLFSLVCDNGFKSKPAECKNKLT